MSTIKDIARECGVSAVSVSAVLNNKQGEVSAATRVRVLEATARLNYRPNAVARRMVGKQMNTIGIADRTAVSSYWLSPYDLPVFEGIVIGARRSRWEIAYFAGHPTEDLPNSLSAYADGRCDGMIFFSHGLSLQETELMVSTGLPIVLVGECDCSPDVSIIDVDNVQASYEAVHFLIQLGHKRIAMIESDRCASNAQRVIGYERALVDAKLPIDPTLRYTSLPWDIPAREVALNILSQPEHRRPTAIFCFNDGIAVGVLQAASENNISVPGQLSVFGFDDIYPASQCSPQLTTVRQPLRLMGERATDILIDLVGQKLPKGYREYAPHELVIRGTTAPPLSA